MKEPGSIDARCAGVRVLLIDNYSSFTYNLYQYLAELTGVLPTVVANDSAEPLSLDRFDAVVLSPGPGTPERTRDFGICRAMLSQEQLPVLGVCLGHQGLGVYEGARLAAAPELFHGRKSQVLHQGGPLFAGIPSGFEAIRYHSLVLQRPLPDSLECIAETSDGQVMALRHRTRPYWGVQFHPESIASEYGPALLANFCALCLVREGQPAVEEARAKRGPVAKPRWRRIRHRLEAGLDVEELFAKLFSASKEAYWLDGSESQGHSYMGDCEGPRSYRIRYDRDSGRAEYAGARSELVQGRSIFDLLEDELDAVQLADPPEELSFAGGFVGYFGYELRAELGSKTRHISDLPDAHWIWSDRYLAYDHKQEQASLVVLLPEEAPDEEARAWFREVEDKLASEAALTALPRGKGKITPTLRDTREHYEAKIAECLECISRGESYELCLTTEFSADLQVDAYQLFRVLRAQNPAPYAAYLRCDDFAVVSASPERFLKMTSDRWVESKPIKGTARRDEDASLDAALAESLRSSEKERAENLMIVDLVRNDLGKNCEVGSVVVKELAAVESYATVHQLVSTIGGRLRSGLSPLQCVRDAFPGGSMTGAPKARSMEILDALETGPRGAYSGSIGYLSCDGALDLSIVIRSVVVTVDRVRLGVGGAITALSQSAEEFEEVQLKAKAQLAALAALASQR